MGDRRAHFCYNIENSSRSPGPVPVLEIELIVTTFATMRQTTWDKIYKNYEKGGPAWATLSDPIHPSFRSFLKRTRFDVKSALDLGCGDGRYLKLLQKTGFAVSGIDSSPTAIKMSKETREKCRASRGGYFHLAHPRQEVRSHRFDRYDSARKKPAIKRLIGRIYKSLLPNGKAFITFPMMASVKQWGTFKNAKKIATGVYVPFIGPEKGLPHSFYGKNELGKLFSEFFTTDITRDDIGKWVVRTRK